MSKFFRSATTDTSTSDLSDAPESLVDNGTALANLHIHSPIHADPAQMMLHSLLEEKCLNEATRQWTANHGHRKIDHNSIQQIAKAKYHNLVRQLDRNKLIAPGLEGDTFSSARQHIRNGLGMLLSQSDIPSSRERLIENDQQLQLVKFQAANAGPIQRIGPSQYLANFEEIGVLGKGGYGVVYHVRHKLDQCEYAVKKVPISAARAQRIRTGSDDELAKLLQEPRTMAKLSHENIVRYHSSWVEYSNTQTPALPQSGSSRASSSGNESIATLSDNGAVLGAADDRSLQRISTISDEAHATVDVLFENSTSPGSGDRQGDLQRAPSSVTDSESVADGNRPDLSEPYLSGVRGLTVPLAESCYFLHLQMGLYPMSLADFLSPDVSTSISPKAPAIRHCFHLQPTLSILLAIINGLLYLHEEGIVHGDLKPANILMAPNNNPRDRRGSIDLMLCNECRASGHAHPISLDIRIGDFGLATALDEAPVTPQKTPGGTAMYRPMTETIHHNTYMDIFALGIIAFELLWKFNTKMERHEALHSLKREGAFPEGGEEGVADVRIRRCITQLMAGDVTLSKLRQDLVALQDAYRSKEL